MDIPVVTTSHGCSSPRIVPAYRAYDDQVHDVAVSAANRHPDLTYTATIHHGIDLDGLGSPPSGPECSAPRPPWVDCLQTRDLDAVARGDVKSAVAGLLREKERRDQPEPADQRSVAHREDQRQRSAGTTSRPEVTHQEKHARCHSQPSGGGPGAVDEHEYRQDESAAHQA